MKKANFKIQPLLERVPRAAAAAILSSALSAFVLTGTIGADPQSSPLLSIMLLCALFTALAEFAALPDSVLLGGAALFVCADCALFFIPYGGQSIYTAIIEGAELMSARLLPAVLLLCGALCLVLCMLNRRFSMRCIIAGALFVMLLALIWLRYTLFTVPAILITAYIIIVICQVCATRLSPAAASQKSSPRDMWFIMFSLLTAVIIFSIPTPNTRIQWEKLFEIKYSKELEQLSNALDIDKISDSDEEEEKQSQSGYTEDQSDLGGMIELVFDVRLQVEFSHAPHADRLTGGIYDSYNGKGWVCTSDIVGSGYGTVTEKPSSLALPTRYERACISFSDTVSETDAIRDTVFYLPYSHSIISDDTGLSAYRDGPHMTFGEECVSGYTVYYYDEPCEYKLSDSEREQYLALPDNLPRRVKKLALETVEGCNDDEGRVLALMRFFNDYQYETKVSSLPAGRDFVDYFLFTTKKGYCAYYASSLTVMARCVGIPSRYVQGYYIGSDVLSLNVSSNNAHAWAELYIDGRWVICDPVIAPVEDIIDNTDESKAKINSSALRSILYYSYAAIAAAAVIIALFMPFFRRLPRRIRIKRKYSRHLGYPIILQCEKLLWVLSACGAKRSGHETLTEFGNRVCCECDWLGDTTCDRLCDFLRLADRVLYSEIEHSYSTDKKLPRHIKKDYIRKRGLSAYIKGHRRAAL